MTQILIEPITDKPRWEKFVKVHPDANFLQSYNWGLFNQKLVKKFFPLAIFATGQQVGAAMVIKETAKRGNYLTIAGGPLLNWQAADTSELFQALIKYLQQLAQQENCIFIRIRPQALASSAVKNIFTQAGLKPAPMHLTADLTLQLDLTQTDEQLLAQMRKNTRYEIKKGLKIGVSTKLITDLNFIDEFYQQQLFLAKKHNFVPFAYEFLRLQFETFLADNQVAFVNSYQNEQLLASAFVIFYQKEAVYHYGVSTVANERLPGSYVAQWAAIREARARGCTVYNFWGVSPLTNPDHRFAGVSLFKRGFGGQEIQHLPAQDLATSPLYGVTKIFELIRKKTRNL